MYKVSRRSCSVISCSNSWYKIEKWMQEQCEIHKCNKGTGSCDCSPPFQLIPFPTERKDPAGRKKWTTIVNRKNGNNNWQPNSESRICSKHFVDCEPTLSNPLPTLDLGYTPIQVTKFRPPPRERHDSPPPKKTKRKLENDLSVEDLNKHITSDHDYMYIQDTDCNREVILLRDQVQKLQKEVNMYKSAYIRSVNTKRKTTFDINVILQSDKKCKFYTGIPKVETFNDFFIELEQKVRQMRHWKGPKRTCNPLKNKKYTRSNSNRKLSLKFEFALTLMKLRLGLLFEDLADRFGISTTHASNIFTTWIKVLSSTIGSLVFNPSKEAVKTNLPPSFKGTKYIDVRHIIDCTEVFLERPNNLEVAAQTWSDYKHHNTAKFLVSINPSGLINYVSEGFGGRCSDKYITNNSGFLDILEPYDCVMADRGFTIREELALVRAQLFIPPGRRGVTQMSTNEVQQTKEIANRRIHIEQAIRRMKYFRILKYEVPLTLMQHLDSIFKTIAGICNMYPPLPKYET
ncbi:uncharacterized protein LOC127717711 [Mytilus californianus]|uniref:uncharacterized protein LOC127717711 n=1 Tax=Mytilus californianus TaxID=6549 RepID=UPI002248757D|nr:uncharacterized protein LOC127717711 [Mytilus californianus]